MEWLDAEIGKFSGSTKISSQVFRVFGPKFGPNTLWTVLISSREICPAVYFVSYIGKSRLQLKIQKTIKYLDILSYVLT